MKGVKSLWKLEQVITMSMLDYPNPLTVSDIAQYYGKGGRWLNNYLAKKGLIYKNEYGEWTTSKFVYENGYTIKIYAKCNGDMRGFLKWTKEGREYIHKLLIADGYTAK